MRMITPGMARSLTPVEFVHRDKEPARQRGGQLHVEAVRAAFARLAHSVRHPRLRHVGH